MDQIDEVMRQLDDAIDEARRQEILLLQQMARLALIKEQLDEAEQRLKGVE